jgi:hypothetical protein
MWATIPQPWIQGGIHRLQADPAMSPRQVADPILEPGTAGLRHASHDAQVRESDPDARCHSCHEFVVISSVEKFRPQRPSFVVSVTDASIRYAVNAGLSDPDAPRSLQPLARPGAGLDPCRVSARPV